MNMKVKVIKVKNYHQNKIDPYVRDMIIDLKNFDPWKIWLRIAINFISLKDAGEEHVIVSKSDNIKFMSYNDANEVVGELFKPLNSR